MSKNDLNGKIFSLSLSLSVSWTNIALHVVQRQCSSMLGMSNLGGKLLPLVPTPVFWLLFLFLALSSPLQRGPALPQRHLRGQSGVQGTAASNHSDNHHWCSQNDLRGKMD